MLAGNKINSIYMQASIYLSATIQDLRNFTWPECMRACAIVE